MTPHDRDSVVALFDEKPPILIEVQFPRMGTSPDSYLYQAASEVDSLWDRVSPAVEIHFHSVWDLKDDVRPMTIVR